jgi:molecular chaperone GrpE
VSEEQAAPASEPAPEPKPRSKRAKPKPAEPTEAAGPADTELSPELLEELEALADLVEKDTATAVDEPGGQDLQALVDERTADLQRLQAEYANYKKRVDRDRALSRQAGVEAVLTQLLPVLDSIAAAREHEELVGGFKGVAEQLEQLAAKHGLEFFGEPGEPFDPKVHEALLQMPYEGEIAEPTVAAVMQKGVKLGERILRPARVGVANPE